MLLYDPRAELQVNEAGQTKQGAEEGTGVGACAGPKVVTRRVMCLKTVLSRLWNFAKLG